MVWWGVSRTLTVNEDSDELVFISTLQKRKGDLLIGGTIALAGLIALAVWQSFIGFMGAEFFAAVYVCGTFLSKVQRLVVTERRLIGTKRSAAWKDVFEIRYEGGGEDGPIGLCARTSRWSSMCVFEDVSRDDCALIIEKIYRRWPSLHMAERPESFLAAFRKGYKGRA